MFALCMILTAINSDPFIIVTTGLPILVQMISLSVLFAEVDS